MTSLNQAHKEIRSRKSAPDFLRLHRKKATSKMKLFIGVYIIITLWSSASTKPLLENDNHLIARENATKTIDNMKDVVIKYVREKHPEMEKIKQKELVNAMMRRLTRAFSIKLKKLIFNIQIHES